MRILCLCLITFSVFAATPLPRGDRILAVDVTMDASADYGTAFLMARALDIRDVGLSLDWSSIESAPGVFDVSIAEIANAFYPAYGTGISLTLRPVHTVSRTVPADLDSTSFAAPEMASRFNAMLDAFLAAMPDTCINSIIIGSEVNIFFGTDTTAWANYTTFYTTVANHIHSTYPDIPVACEVTADVFSSGMDSELLALNAVSDIFGLSYYPLAANFQVQPTTVIDNLFTTASAATTLPIWIYQFGYPSDALNGSSEAMQAEFIDAAFAAWDGHADRIKMIDFTWQHDRSPMQLADDLAFYGDLGPEFTAFLSSLGLRNYDGSAKLGWGRLVSEASVRGWTTERTLSVTLSPNIPGTMSQHVETKRWLVFDSSGTINIGLLPRTLDTTIDILTLGGDG